MTDIPEEVLALAAEREERRMARDFAAADGLRDRIAELGFRVVDSPEGSKLEFIRGTPEVTSQKVAAARVRPEAVSSALEDPPTADVSVQWVAQGWPEDVIRGIESFRAVQGERAIQHVVVDAAGTDPGFWPEGVDVISLDGDYGWGVDRNVGLRRSTGRIVVVVDSSIEAAGDVLGPLEAALADSSVGVAGPFGIVTEDLRDFHESPGPDVDAVEGYLMAFRQEVLHAAGFFDEKFKFYRTADIEYSFRVKELGLRAVVVPVPLRRHEHRMWANTPPEERDRLSKRNYYRFLDRFRGRTDLLVGSREGRGATPRSSG